MTRKELAADVKRRIAAGESKRAIFSRYTMTEWEDLATRLLAIQVTPAKRKQWRYLNVALIICLSIITLFKTIDLFFLTGSMNGAGARIGVLLIGLTFNIVVLVGVIRYSGVVYLLTCVFILQSFSKIFEVAGKINFAVDISTAIFVVNVFLLLASFVLALILYRLLLPCTTFFLTAQRTATGQPIFED